MDAVSLSGVLGVPFFNFDVQKYGFALFQQNEI